MRMVNENYEIFDEEQIGGEELLDLREEDELASIKAKEKRRGCWKKKHHYKCDNRQKAEMARRKRAQLTTAMWKARKFRPVVRENVPT